MSNAPDDSRRPGRTPPPHEAAKITHLAKHLRTIPGSVARAIAIKWSRSLLDSRFHAIDEMADHPKGAYRAECGHMLLAVTVLRDAPIGAVCEVCHARTRPLDYLWRALPGEPVCADSGLEAADSCCALVAGHGDDIDDAARDGATSGRRER